MRLADQAGPDRLSVKAVADVVVLARRAWSEKHLGRTGTLPAHPALIKDGV